VQVLRRAGRAPEPDIERERGEDEGALFDHCKVVMAAGRRLRCAALILAPAGEFQRLQIEIQIARLLE